MTRVVDLGFSVPSLTVYSFSTDINNEEINHQFINSTTL